MVCTEIRAMQCDLSQGWILYTYNLDNVALYKLKTVLETYQLQTWLYRHLLKEGL